MERAVNPKTIASIGVVSSRFEELFNQCKVEKYKPTPGATLIIDYRAQGGRIMQIMMKIEN